MYHGTTKSTQYQRITLNVHPTSNSFQLWIIFVWLCINTWLQSTHNTLPLSHKTSWVCLHENWIDGWSRGTFWIIYKFMMDARPPNGLMEKIICSECLDSEGLFAIQLFPHCFHYLTTRLIQIDYIPHGIYIFHTPIYWV